jgi:hypothetical protein
MGTPSKTGFDRKVSYRQGAKNAEDAKKTRSDFSCFLGDLCVLGALAVNILSVQCAVLISRAR